MWTVKEMVVVVEVVVMGGVGLVEEALGEDGVRGSGGRSWRGGSGGRGGGGREVREGVGGGGMGGEGRVWGGGGVGGEGVGEVDE